MLIDVILPIVLPDLDHRHSRCELNPEILGEDRIIQLMTSHASLSMRDIIEALKADTDQFRDGATDQFRDGAEQNDDLTMLAFRITNRQ